MLDKDLVRSIIDMFIFLEFSDDSQVDADLAVAQMEALSTQLQRVSEPTKADLITQIGDLAPDYGEHSDFVQALPQAMGLE